MKNSIGNMAIKISCMQVIPGEELNVKSSLESACSSVGIKEKEFVILKGFGTFDIIMFYLTKDLGFNLSKAGPIHNVLKSNLLLCYPFKTVDIHKLFDLLSKKLFTGISLIKINPGLQYHLPGIENDLRAYFSEETKYAVLGSLGWNEIILLINEDDIDRLCKALFNVGLLVYEKNGTKFSILTKTLSFIGMNYKIIPPLNEIKNFNRTKKFLDKTSSLRKAKIVIEKSALYPSLDIAAKPMSMTAIKNFFSPKGFETNELLGKQDLMIKPQKEMTWSHFLASVLNFRQNYKGKIFSTSIRLGLDRIVDLQKCKDIRYSRKPFDFDFNDLKKAFGNAMALPLANHLYSFSNLSQNPLCWSAFADMIKFPPYIIDMGLILNQRKQNTLSFAQGAMHVLRYGTELRSYGTYETIEEVTGRFSEFRGGCQQALLAIELLPSLILKRLGIDWKGFVITGYYKFFHVNEVINVPTEAIWNPQRWWALYHEIGHIIIDCSEDWFNEKLPSIRLFLANKNFPEKWLRLINECVAEVIGFELGFMDNYKLFFEKLWNHLVEIEAFQSATIDIEEYAIRSFFTKIFEGHFRRIRNVDYITKDQFCNLEFSFQGLVAHMNLIEKTVGKSLFKNKLHVAAENAKFFKEIYPYVHHLSGKMSGVDLRPGIKTLSYKNTKEVLRSLNRGKIWLKEITSPEAVLYSVIQEPAPFFSKRVATILSFWNQQMNRIKPRSR